MSQKKYQVSRVSKTKGSVDIGMFNTLAEAKNAMGLHFVRSPKRGKFFYAIQEVEVKEIGGVEMIICGLGGSPYYKKYSKEELFEIHRLEFD